MGKLIEWDGLRVAKRHSVLLIRTLDVRIWNPLVKNLFRPMHVTTKVNLKLSVNFNF